MLRTSPLETAWALTLFGSAMLSPKVMVGVLPKVSVSPFFGIMPATTHMSFESDVVREVEISPSIRHSSPTFHFELSPNALVIESRSPPLAIMSLELASPSSLPAPAMAGLLA